MWDVQPYTLDLSDVICLSDEDLMKLSEANPDLAIEQNAAGQLEIMAAAGSDFSALETPFAVALWKWNEDHQFGIVLSGTGGVRLPNGAMRAADAAIIARAAWDPLPAEKRRGYAPVVPEFLVEVRSPSNSLSALQRKMQEWMENGCRLGWLVDPDERSAYVYRADGSVEEKSFDMVLSGEDVLPRFEFDLSSLDEVL